MVSAITFVYVGNIHPFSNILWYPKGAICSSICSLGCKKFLHQIGFLIANLEKFPYGGYVTLVVGGALFTVMCVCIVPEK